MNMIDQASALEPASRDDKVRAEQAPELARLPANADSQTGTADSTVTRQAELFNDALLQSPALQVPAEQSASAHSKSLADGVPTAITVPNGNAIDVATRPQQERSPEAFVTDLDARMAKSELEEMGWRDRTDLGDVMRDLERLASADWRKAATLWDKYRPGDEDKPIFIDGDDKDPPALAGRSGRGDTTNAPQAPRDPDQHDTGKESRGTESDPQPTIPKALVMRYLVADNKFYFRDDANLLAFEDKGKRLATEHNDPLVARSMVELAEAKGWTSLKVKGTDEFRREVWKSASLRGMDVHGYQPSEADKAALAERLKEFTVRSQNSIEQSPEREKVAQRTARVDRPNHDAHNAAHPIEIDETKEARLNLTKPQRIAVDTLRAILTERGDPTDAVEMAAQLAAERFQQRRVYVGRLIGHGAARYNNDPKENPSYFVTLKTKSGERTVWGVDLERALAAGAAKPDDDLAIVFRGKKRMKVPVPERDDKGNLTGQQIDTVVDRNTWEIGTLDKMREEARERLHKAASQSERNEPTISVYGPAPKTKSPTPNRETPRAAEPTRSR